MSSFESVSLERLSPGQTAELAVRFPKIAGSQAVRRMLDTRHHWTAKQNLATPEQAAGVLAGVRRATEHNTLWMKVYYDPEDGEPIGLGTLIRRLPLRQLKAKIPPLPGLRNLFMADPAVEAPGSNVTAWIDPRRENSKAELQDAYTGLAQLAMHHSQEGNLATSAVWTIEPDRAQEAYGTHDVLRAAGLAAVNHGYFDDGESNWHPVLESTLFTGPGTSTGTGT